MHSEGKKILRENRKIYELYIKLLLRSKLDDLAFLDGIKSIAQFAANTHVGLFSDHRLEAPLLRIASDLEQRLNIPKVSPEHSKPLLVHIASTLYPVGGHIRFIERIINYDKEFTHHLLITDQGEVPYSKLTIEKIKAAGGEVVFLDQPDMLEKAAFIRGYIRQAAFIFLHIHPHDPIPVVALGVKELPAVCFINHADHAFWLGVSVADIVADIRYSSQEVTLKRRMVRLSKILPLPIDQPELILTKEEAKAKLGFEEDDILIFTMGSYYKFLPAGPWSFFPLLVEVLNKLPETRLVIVGLSEEMDLDRLGYIKHPRIEMMGVLEDPAIFQRAADIVIDPIPYGSYTSFLESCAHGAYPVVLRNIIPAMTLAEDPALKDKVRATNDLDSFKEILLDVVNKREFENSLYLQEEVISYHRGKDWEKYYEDLKSELKKGHFVHLFESEYKDDDENDLNLAYLNLNRREREKYLLLLELKKLKINFGISSVINSAQLISRLSRNEPFFLRLKILGNYLIQMLSNKY